MAPVKKCTLEHFSHPGHQLNKFNSTEFICDGCKTEGTGTRYRCHPCEYDLHAYCATCPQVLSTFMHLHPLNLVKRSAQATIQRTCDVCSENVEGLFYRCKGCDFDVHPVCTQMPQKVSHIYHPMHTLILQGAPAGWFCGVCAGECGTKLRYRCVPCNFDIHPQCIVILGSGNETRNTTAAPPPSYNGFPYGAPGEGSSSSNPNSMYNYMNQHDPNNMYNYMNEHDPNNLINQVQAAGTSNGSGNGASMFAVVGKLVGAFSNMASGTDFTSFM